MRPETDSTTTSATMHPDTPFTPLTTIRPSSIGGLGVFTLSPITPGTLLLVETPLLTVREPRTPTTVVTGFTHLTPSQQALYLTLHAQHPDTPVPTRVVDIFNSNAWQTGSSTSLLAHAARFNHACVPNATFAWDARSHAATVRAVAPIPTGAEVTLSYTLPYAVSAARRAKLAAYGFECACAACSSPASDERRARLVVLEARVRVAKKQAWRVTMPRAAMEIVRLLRDEGLVGEALGLALHEVAVGWRRFGRVDLAARYAARELEVCVMCYGADSACVEASSGFLRELEAELHKEGEGEKGVEDAEVSAV
jgi:hypothetical protein